MNKFFKNLILAIIWLNILGLSLCGFLFLEPNFAVAESNTKVATLEVAEAKQKETENEEEEEDDDDC